MDGLTGKALALGGVAAALLITSGQAYAQLATCPAHEAISLLTPGFSCTLGDKTFSDFTITGAPSSADIGFGTLGPLFAVTLTRDGTFFPVGTLVFDYTITAATPNHIVMGSLGVDVSFPTVTTITTMNGLALTPASLTNGGTAMITFGPGVSSVIVDNTSHIMNSTSQLNSVSNDFSQVMISVPEPASLSLFGLGLLGLGLGRRRRS